MKIILGMLFLIGVTLYADMGATKKAMNEYKKGHIQEAVKLLSKSCDGGELNACVNLGYMYARGLSVKKDFSRGYSLLKKACDGGKEKGCIVLGNAVLEEEGNLWYNFQKSKEPTTKDKLEHKKRVAVGISYLKKACKSGSAVGCSSLGEAYWNFVQQNGGVKKLPKMQKKAVDALTKACDLKDIKTCLQLAYSFENMGEKKFPQATILYKKACDFGYKKACNDYDRLHRAGY